MTHRTELGRRARLAIALATPLFRTWMSTLRIRWHASEATRALVEDETPVIYALWHETLLPTLWTHRDQGLVAMVSRHRDGEMLTRLIERLGFEAARGSTTRGGATALRELVRLAQEGRSLAITPDGPKGPRRVVQPGAVEIARQSGRPIVPGTLRFRPQHRFGSWDRMLLPYPFGAGVVLLGDPITVEADADVAAESARLQAAFDHLTERAEGDYKDLRRGGSRKAPHRKRRRAESSASSSEDSLPE